MGKYIDLTGMIFGKCKVIKRDINCKDIRWICQCECGTIRSVSSSHLRSGSSKSCGCVARKTCSERMKRLNTKHNLSKTQLYTIWHSMKQRCYDINNSNYKNYGERGIKVCDEWINNFVNFYNWSILNGWKKEKLKNGKNKFSIDRIDVNGNYEPNNCKWSTFEEQAVNTTRNHFVTFEGKTLTLSQWARLKNIKYSLIVDRVKRGWDFKDAVYTPVRKIKQKVL